MCAGTCWAQPPKNSGCGGEPVPDPGPPLNHACLMLPGFAGNGAASSDEDEFAPQPSLAAPHSPPQQPQQGNGAAAAAGQQGVAAAAAAGGEHADAGGIAEEDREFIATLNEVSGFGKGGCGARRADEAPPPLSSPAAVCPRTLPMPPVPYLPPPAACLPFAGPVPHQCLLY